MSTLTEAVLYVPILSGSREREMSAALTEPPPNSNGQTFRPLDIDAAGGHKVFCGAVYAACFNHVIPEDVEEFVRALPWGYTSGVLVIDYEHDDELRVVQVGAEVSS